MKKFGVARPWKYTLGLTLLCTALNAPSAQAGNWQFRLVYSREKSSTAWSTSQNAMVTTTTPTTITQTSWQTSGEANVSNSLFAAGGRQGLTASAQQKNAVMIELHWQPAPNQTVQTDPPSVSVFLKLRAQATTVLTPQDNSTHSESNGLRTTSVLTSTTTNGQGQTTVTWESSNWNGNPSILAIDNNNRISDIQFGPFEVVSQGSVRQPTTVVTSYPGSSYVQDKGSLVQVFTALGASLSTYGAYISSDIEKSWKKWTGAVANLPNAYKMRDSSGNFINQPNDNAVQVAGQDTPLITTDDVWKLACLRVPGGMSVESAAQWTTTPDGAFKAWLGGGVFTAQQSGFQTPITYTWTEPPLSHNSNTGSAPQTDVLTPNPPTFSTPYYGIKLGENLNGSDLLNSSTISVQVSDALLSMTDNYTINWHKPYEWQKDNLRPMTTGYDWNTTASSWIHADAVSHLTVSKEPPTVKWGFVGKSASYALSGASVYVGANGLAALGLATLSVPETAGLSLLLYAASLAVVEATPTPEQPEQIPITYAMWESAVTAQKQINANRAAGITDNSSDRLFGFTPQQVTNAYNGLNATNPVNDSFWNNGLSIKCDIARNYEETYYLADQFDKNGFVAPNVPGSLRVQKNRYPVYRFKVEGSTTPDPTPQPNDIP